MIDFLGGILEFVFDMVEMVLGLAFGAVELVFGLLGGLASLVFSLLGFWLAAVLIIALIRRVRRKKQPRNDVLVDENGEVFNSYYHQEAR